MEFDRKYLTTLSRGVRSSIVSSPFREEFAMDCAPHHFAHRHTMIRSTVARITIGLLLLASSGLIGCESFLKRKKETQFEKDSKRIKSIMTDVDRPRLVGEVATVAGFAVRKYDAIGLANNLPGTGGGVRPSEQREMLLAEMRVRDVINPERIIDSPSSATVKLSVYTQPGDLKGEVLDIEVESSSQCFATDLRDGFVLPARLKDLVLLDNRVRKSRDFATGTGEIVVLPTSFTKRNELEPLKGIIVGGGRLLEDRKLGLRLNPEYQHVYVTKSISGALNQRFYFRDSTKQQTIAEGKNDRDILLSPMPKYRNDPDHFVSVVLATGFGESQEQIQERLQGCKKLLGDRTTCRRAAAELEGIGTPEAAEVLLSGLNASDPEVRFHSAYALSYLDHKDSVPVLVELARSQPAFRPLCLTGLSSNDDRSARLALEELLQESEPELRFGAFWAIRNRNALDPYVTGETMGDDLCQFVQIPSSIPLIAVSLQKKKEIVLFGSNIGITLTTPIAVSTTLKLAPAPNNKIRISKRHLNGEVGNAEVLSDVYSLLKGLGAVSANYGDVVHSLDQLAQNQCLQSPVAMNPRPHAGRVFRREDQDLAASLSIDRSKAKDPWWSISSLWGKSSRPEDPPPEKNTESESVFDEN